MRHDGGRVIVVGAALGLAVSIYDFVSPVGLFAPLSDVSGTAGAGLVIFATAVLTLLGIVLSGNARNVALIVFVALGALAAILGTALAGWLLDNWVLVALMALCLVGWCVRIFAHDADAPDLQAEA